MARPVKDLPKDRIADPDALFALCDRLYPICRSITGPGVRETLAVIQESIELSIIEVPSGTPVFDWTVPLEWTLREAWVEDPSGTRVIDVADHNLHVVSYSTPVDMTLSREALEAHLHSLPEQPDAIPYRTSYYAETWGFCVSHERRTQLPKGTYRVHIDATLAPGSMSYGECFIPGTSGKEILVSTHICHPSLANDNLSGISVATHLAKHFANAGELRHGMRFVFVPGTIGAITWLAQNEDLIPNIISGLVLSGIGDSGPLTYKRSRRGDGLIDRLFEHHLAALPNANIRPFIPYGYDERQYCSPGIDISAGCLMRTPYGEYPEYHSSGDNLAFINAASLAESAEVCARVLQDAQCVDRYRNLQPKCEPQLGRRGLYDNVGGENQSKDAQLALLWMLSYSDGHHSTLDIQQLSGIDLTALNHAAERLIASDLLALEPFGAI